MGDLQPFLELHKDRSKPSWERSDPPRRSKSPSKPSDAPNPDLASQKPIYTHYALLGLNKSQPPRRLKAFTPWPPRCKETSWLCFETEKDAKKWLEPTNGTAYKIWLCEYCNKFHVEPNPHEVTGTSSGKNLRKWEFLRNKGIEPDYE
jgi:hypothetical protein